MEHQANGSYPFPSNGGRSRGDGALGGPDVMATTSLWGLCLCPIIGGHSEGDGALRGPI